MNELNMEELDKVFYNIYDWIYAKEDTNERIRAIAELAMEEYEERWHEETDAGDFKKNAILFMQHRHDGLTSDRELASFTLAYYALGGNYEGKENY